MSQQAAHSLLIKFTFITIIALIGSFCAVIISGWTISCSACWLTCSININSGTGSSAGCERGTCWSIAAFGAGTCLTPCGTCGWRHECAESSLKCCCRHFYPGKLRPVNYYNFNTCHVIGRLLSIWSVKWLVGCPVSRMGTGRSRMACHRCIPRTAPIGVIT